MQDMEDKHFISLSLKKHLNALQQEEVLGTYSAPDAESPLGTGHTLQIGAPIIIIKFVEAFSEPGTVLSVDLCNPPI